MPRSLKREVCVEVIAQALLERCELDIEDRAQMVATCREAAEISTQALLQHVDKAKPRSGRSNWSKFNDKRRHDRAKQAASSQKKPEKQVAQKKQQAKKHNKQARSRAMKKVATRTKKNK